jgi:preprotein translocase subunit SecA
LLIACKLTGERFQEFEEWLEACQHDAELRREWYRKNPMFPSFLDEEEGVDDYQDEERLAPPDTIVRDARIGRNDPCPCGSGKKFKKCCLAKYN